MIRLPKRNDEESDADGEPENENDADNEGGDGMILEPEEVAIEKVAPMGGGKPFRKIQGQVYIIDGDEFVTEDNPKGDEKIDKFGNLLGGPWFLSFLGSIVGLNRSARSSFQIPTITTT